MIYGKKFLYYVPIIIALFLFACGQGGGEQLVGVLGGGTDGYGIGNEIPGTDGNGGNTTDQTLVGSWRSDLDSGSYVILTFNTNGTYSLLYDFNSGISEEEGTYQVQGNQIILNGEDVLNYSITNNTLTIITEDGPMIFYRI